MTEQMAEYVECRNKSWRERRDKQKEINYFTGFDDGYHECEKEHEWHDINEQEPSKEQFGKQLLIRMESVIGDTDYDYLVYKYKGESISDVAGVLAWKEIE